MNRYEKYLSFGFNCELSMVLKQADIFSSSLFSWGFCFNGTDTLVNTLLNPEYIFLSGAAPVHRSLFRCDTLKIGFHARIRFSEIKDANGSLNQELFNDNLEELKERVRYLTEKQRLLITNNHCLIIVKWDNHPEFNETQYTPITSAMKLKKTLDIVYPNASFDILYVFETNAASGIFNWNDEDNRIYGRSINKFAPLRKANMFNYDDWINLALREFITVGN